MDLRTRARENRYAIWILLLIFCVFQYGIRKICGFSIYPDEFGYWATAARAVGYDWTETASLGYYYSFGYGLLLCPILRCFGGGVMAYRAALCLNMLLMCASLFLVERILGKLFADLGRESRFLLGGMAVLYPPWLYYMQMTLAEALLFFLFILDVYLLLQFVERQKMSTAAALAVSLAYGYCVHMRMAATVIAGILTLALWCVFGKGKKKSLLAGAAALLIAAVIAWWMKGRTVAETFALAEKEMLAVNDYSGQIAKLKEALTLSGMLRLLESMAGKLYYLCMASFGTFCWGLAWCLRRCAALARNVARREKTSQSQWLALFLLLAAAGQIAVSSIYTYGSVTIGALIYGRYNEMLVPVMMAIGTAAMMQSRRLIRITAAVWAALGGGTLWLLWEIKSKDLGSIRGWHVPGLSYLLHDENMDRVSFVLRTWLLGTGLALLVCACVWLGRRYGNSRYVLCAVLAMEVAAGIQISSHYVYQANNELFQNRVIVERLEEETEAGREIWYLEEGKQTMVDYLQMQFPDRTIHVVRPDELEQTDLSKDILVVSVMTEQDGTLTELFDRRLAASLFILYYN